MTDLTNTNLEAAIIDQKVAGAFHDKRYAFTAVTCSEGFQLGVAIENEQGYHALAGKYFDSYNAATEWADSLNRHIGLSEVEAIHIVCSTMRGKTRRKD